MLTRGLCGNIWPNRRLYMISHCKERKKSTHKQKKKIISFIFADENSIQLSISSPISVFHLF